MSNITFHVGTSGFGYKEWKEAFYPEDLPAKKMLGYYAERFSTVEINHTFRRMPKAKVLDQWASQVPKDFQFVLKAPQRITHFQRLAGCEASVGEFLEVATVLKRRLGPALFQLPGNFKKDVPRLRDFLKLLPAGQRVAFEFRHDSWFDQEVLALLRKKKAALCIAEADDTISAPLVATAEWGYLRLRLAEYSDRDLKKWIKDAEAQAWEEVFVFFKHEDEAKGPVLAQRFLKLCGRSGDSRSLAG